MARITTTMTAMKTMTTPMDREIHMPVERRVASPSRILPSDLASGQTLSASSTIC
jgi:hypothetical protein